MNFAGLYSFQAKPMIILADLRTNLIKLTANVSRLPFSLISPSSDPFTSSLLYRLSLLFLSLFLISVCILPSSNSNLFSFFSSFHPFATLSPSSLPSAPTPSLYPHPLPPLSPFGRVHSPLRRSTDPIIVNSSPEGK